jgi:hypothetical protein
MYNLRPFKDAADLATTAQNIIKDWLTTNSTIAPANGKFAKDAIAALDDPGKVALPNDLEGLIKDDPTPGTNGAGDRFVLYAVYEHAPCRPVVSRPSRIFTLAPAMDPDAPARKIRIQLPDINHMRRFSRGVALEMPPSLRRVVDRVHKGMLKGDDLGHDPGLELGMICSFSFQIIFLVAFLVMFIFLILFNIIFWWLPFLKICFPIPRKPRGS